MKETKIKKDGLMEIYIEKRKIYGKKCPYCKEIIKSYNEVGVNYNLEVHINKHIRNGDKISIQKQKLNINKL